MVRLPGRQAALKALAGLAVASALVAWLVPALAAPRAGAAQSATALLGGVNIGGSYASSAQIDREMAAAHALHAKVVRTELVWSELQPLEHGALDARSLATADRIMSDAAAYGIRVIAFVDSTPCWASSAPAQVVQECVPGRPSRADSWPPSTPDAYASLMAMFAQRYGPRLAALEVWNEPDQSNQRYFAGPEKASRYATLLRAAYTAIKQANPQVSVLAGSIVGSNGEFLRALYAAGIKGYYDGLAVHYYTLTLGALRSIHETQLANGDATPLWLDEFGWSSCWPKRSVEQEQGCVTARTQAENYATVFRSLVSAPYVAAAVVYKLVGHPRRRIRRAEPKRHTQAVVQHARRGHRLPGRQAGSGEAAPATSLRASARQRLRSGGRLHGSRSVPRQHASLSGAVHARPLQPLLARIAPRARDEEASGTRIPVLVGTGASRRCAQLVPHSATWKSATKVSARIFRSRPSDQCAM